jgi:CO/xanthine dehydrogenase Mo-binding subunit
MDELAQVSGIDPVELRIRNDTDHEAEGGAPFTSRSYVECLREGSQRFGWSSRDPRPGLRRDGNWLIGSGMASSAYPAASAPSTATAVARPDGTFIVEIAASDIGTGARTVLTQIAADALGVTPARVQLRVGDSGYGSAFSAALKSGYFETPTVSADVRHRCAPYSGSGSDEVSSSKSDRGQSLTDLRAYLWKSLDTQWYCEYRFESPILGHSA